MGMKVFITGAGGYLGSVLATQLASMPEIDRITGIDVTLPPSPFPDKVKLIKMDTRSPELADAISGHDIVIHCASIVQWLAKMPAAVRDDINFNGARNVAQAAVKNRVRGFLQASSVAAYDPTQVGKRENIGEDFPIGKGDSPLYYCNSKAIAERILTEMLGSSGILLTLFRMTYIIGPCNQATVPSFREDAFLAPGWDPRTQFVHEDDVAEAFAQAIRTDMPGAYNVVPDDSIRYSQFYEIIGAKPRTIPVWLARLVTFIRWRYLGSPTHPSWVRQSLADSFASNAKLRNTGWTPRYNCAEAIRSAM
jgi:UDP-glucose 4-epimerase